MFRNRGPVSRKARQRTSKRAARPSSANPSTTAPRSLSGGGNQIVRTFHRTVKKVAFQASAVSDTFSTWNFLLSDLPNYTEFTSLFDQYRIDEIELRFIPQAGNNSCGPYGYSQPDLLAVVDYDESSTPATNAVLLQYENLQIVHGNQPLTLRFRPRAAVAAYSGTFTSYANVGNLWIDSGSPGVLHYGVKACLTQAAGATDLSAYNIFITYKVSVRNTI